MNDDTSTDDLSDDDDPRVTTTHAEWGAGGPRLLVSGGDQRFTFDLTDDEIAIGSAPESGLRLAGLDPVHAVVHHNDLDEYVVVFRGEGESEIPLDVEGGGDRMALRSGARFTLGDWAFVFQRAEYADHGRPYGGREGGEGDRQRPQPPRPDYKHRDEQD
jgi:hypothetical protein